jgi:PncC family amidohydrolase
MESLLGLDRRALEARGAVSEETARAMAEAARRLLGAGLGLAVTGIAGPGGGTASKPEGLTFVALATDEGVTCERQMFEGGRVERKLRSAIAALELLLRG